MITLELTGRQARILNHLLIVGGTTARPPVMKEEDRVMQLKYSTSFLQFKVRDEEMDDFASVMRKLVQHPEHIAEVLKEQQ